jgi:predicted nucleic acid-binding protein
MGEVFLDAAYAIALAARDDNHHRQALDLADRMQRDRRRIVTTRAVALDIGNALAKIRYRPASIVLLSSLNEDPNVAVVPCPEDLYQRAFSLYRARADKEWGITDCISFVVMQDRGITEALTTDEHFEQAGFRALLRD